MMLNVELGRHIRHVRMCGSQRKQLKHSCHRHLRRMMTAPTSQCSHHADCITCAGHLTAAGALDCPVPVQGRDILRCCHRLALHCLHTLAIASCQGREVPPGKLPSSRDTASAAIKNSVALPITSHDSYDHIASRPSIPCRQVPSIRRQAGSSTV